MMKITGLSHIFKWENLHNWWLTKYFFAPLYLWPAPHSKEERGGVSRAHWHLKGHGLDQPVENSADFGKGVFLHYH